MTYAEHATWLAARDAEQLHAMLTPEPGLLLPEPKPITAPFVPRTIRRKVSR